MKSRVGLCRLRANNNFTAAAPQIESQNIGDVIMVQIFFIKCTHASAADKNNGKAGYCGTKLTKRRLRRFEDLTSGDRDLLLKIFYVNFH